MPGFHRHLERGAVLVLLAVLAGCAVSPARNWPPSAAGASAGGTACPTGNHEIQSGSATTAAVSQTAYQAPAEDRVEQPPVNDGRALLPGDVRIAQGAYGSSDPNDIFAGQPELSLDAVVAEVQARNPSLQAASSAWRAAAQRYPQVISLDDPVFAAMISPRGVGMDDGGGWMVQASQEIPWCGKRALRGSVAAAEADVMRGDIGEIRLRLAEAAQLAYFDYYLAQRQAEVNASTRRLVEQLREIAVNKYQVGQVTQQDVLQADVELADLATRSAELIRDEQVATARINTLLHRAADYPLPPPREISMPGGLPSAAELQQAAVQSRPDLYAQFARIRAEEANLALACREYYPDVNLVARYDGLMPEDMRSQVGLDFNVPIRYDRRSAAVQEACNRVAQRRAEYQDRLDQVRYEVQAAFTRAVQGAEVVRLYRDKTLPAAELSLQSAQSNYTTGNLDFLRLLDAERQLNGQRERYYAALAQYHQQLAELERAVGQPVR